MSENKKIFYMPWCHIDEEYEFNGIKISPSNIENPISREVLSIMRLYKDIEGNTIKNFAIVHCSESPFVIGSGTREESLWEIVQSVTFAALANRGYFGTGKYCNSEHFALFTKSFQDDSPHIKFFTRRRDGHNIDGYNIENVSFTVPLNCKGNEKISLDENLINAFVHKLSLLNEREKARWLNSISCFNQANTDNPSFREQVEWVLLSAAFEQILDANSKANDVAGKFSESFNPKKSILAREANRFGSDCERECNLCYEWMKEFYKLRGDFAHGNLETNKERKWDTGEHLMLATIAFPLLVKSLLAKDVSVNYDLTLEDRIQINVFEKFADTTDFMLPPSDQRSGFDWYWSRLLESETWDLKSEEISLKLTT